VLHILKIFPAAQKGRQPWHQYIFQLVPYISPCPPGIRYFLDLLGQSAYVHSIPSQGYAYFTLPGTNVNAGALMPPVLHVNANRGTLFNRLHKNHASCINLYDPPHPMRAFDSGNPAYDP
jgi:hypothetical protein